MQELTVLIALLAGIIIFVLSPIYGLVIYVVTFSWYPTYLTVPIGTIDFTLRRIVILAIFLRLFALTDLPKRFRFILLDKCVIVYFIAQFLAGITNSSSFMPFLENRGGVVFDMVLPYFAVRMIIKNKQQYLTLLKWILIIAAPLAIAGFYECMTGNNVMGFFRSYNAWETKDGRPLEEHTWVRYGLFRASVVFSHPIMFGLYFAMLGPVCVGLIRGVKRHRSLCIIGLVLTCVGVFASMSSGPLLSCLLAIAFIACYRLRKYWKLVMIIILLMCGIVEIISNRHFYDVFSDFAFNTGNAWYRSRLIDVALFEGGMSGHWLNGFPFGVDPGWGGAINRYGYDFTDIVNHYLKVLYMYGLVGFVPFLAVYVVAVKNLINSYRKSILDSDRWLVWCLSGSLFGLLCAFMTVSIYGPPVTVHYMMIGFAGIIPEIVNKRHHKAQHLINN